MVNFDSIPPELKELKQWVFYKKGDKKPYNPHNNTQAKTNDPPTWGTFKQAVQAVKDYRGVGVGFVFTEDGPYCGIDLDKAIDEDGHIDPEAQAIIERMNSWTEVSQSGHGIHIIGRGKKATNICRKEHVEIYDKGRYFALTGNLWQDRADLNNIQKALDWLCGQTLDEKKKTEPDRPIADGARDNTIASVLGAARRAGANKAELEALAVKMLDRVEQPSGDEKTEKDARRIAESISRYPTADTHLTDTGNAEYLAKIYGADLRYDHRRKRWLRFGPHYWVPDKDGQVARLAIEAAKARYIGAVDIKDSQEKKAASSWAIASESKMRVDACISIASRIKPFADKGDSWDTDRMLPGCENGIIDLHTGTLRPGKPEDRITMSVSMDFDPDAKCPKWEKFLAEIFDDDKELIDWLWRALGYSITGDTTEQIFFVGYGEGGNGKSTFFSMICSVLGDHAYTSPFATFKLPEPSSSNDLATLELRRFVTSCETNKDVSLNLERIKTLTGEDRITARYLYKEFETYPPYLKIWLFVNDKPEINDDSTATWRRLRLIPFNKQFLKNERDLRLGEKLRAESQGVLAWLVKGCLEWQCRGLSDLPACVRARTIEYMKEADTASKFIEGYCVAGENEEVRAGVLYSAYKRWAIGTLDKRKILSQTAFGTYMTKKFEKYEDRRGVHYMGIDLKDKRIHVDLAED